MLDINFEFRKGIFFLRLSGILNKENYQKRKKEIKSLIEDNRFKYIVINMDNIIQVDIYGINYLLEINCFATRNNGNLIICDKTNKLEKLINHTIPSITNELEVL